MHRLRLFQVHLTMIIAFILGYSNRISSESISSHTWSNVLQDLSLKIHDEKTMENYPINEGFILLGDNNKKPATTRTTTSKSIRSFVNNISSTTCKTVVVTIKTTQLTAPVIVNHSIGYLTRRLLNEPNYDTDISTTSKQTPIENEGEIDSFLKVDDDELSKQLINVDTAMDGSGETTEETTEQTSQSIATSLEPTTSSTTTLMTTTAFEQPILRNTTQFILTMNCTNANTILDEILAEFKNKSRFSHLFNETHNISECDNNTGRLDIILEFITDNKTGTVNDLFGNLTEIAIPKGVDISSDNVCGDGRIVRVTNVTSCYLIELCHLCGNPARGVCLPENKESKCECFVNKNDVTNLYVGDLCSIPNSAPIKPVSVPSRWTPVIVGVLAGLTGLFCATTCCLWAMAIWRRRRNHQKYDLRIRRLWNLPRAQIPAAVTSENVQNYLNNTISTLSSRQTESDFDRSNTTDSTFFKELDQKMGENLRSTITRPNTKGMLASLPSDTISTLSTYDPIDELDAIIDNEDVNMIFHDPLNELYEDNEMLEVVNPNLTIPRPNVDSKPTGLFSYFYKNA